MEAGAATKEIAMIRRSFLALAACLAIAWLVPATASAQGGASTLDTAKAKAFIGEWILTIEGRRGPQERPLTIKDVGGKVAAELAGGRGGPVTITDISMTGADLVLKWTQQGPQGEVPVVMTLTLKDGALSVKQDMAGGQFSQTGTGKKKG
jgi:hypothetical protein